MSTPTGKSEPEIELQHYDRIAPGEYSAYCRDAKVYNDPRFQRWTCLLHFDVLRPDMTRIAKGIPAWFGICRGRADGKLRPSRQSRFVQEYVKANGGNAHGRTDRLSPRIFQQRMARVRIDDTNDGAYSKVVEVIRWETGTPAPSFAGAPRDKS